MNEVCYEEVLDQADKNQTLVFVHSRKGTAEAANFIRDMVIEKETIRHNSSDRIQRLSWARSLGSSWIFRGVIRDLALGMLLS